MSFAGKLNVRSDWIMEILECTNPERKGRYPMQDTRIYQKKRKWLKSYHKPTPMQPLNVCRLISMDSFLKAFHEGILNRWLYTSYGNCN